ncbi:unnamed protein product [Lactuca virosa]|uniref:HMA domain-containing protein n=1 Tax=Lactuca virosa TaxID=75947 RepID=A0AAU9M9C3_9ASTR|nr:unnamed protein product [Lactuca virosa]
MLKTKEHLLGYFLYKPHLLIFLLRIKEAFISPTNTSFSRRAQTKSCNLTYSPTSTMVIPKTIILQIDQFCNCDGCIQKVKNTFCELGGVKLLEMNPEIGKFIISTTKHSDVIKYALERTFSKKKVILFENPKHPCQPPIHNHQNVIINHNHIYQVPSSITTNAYDVAKVLATTTHAKGLQSVEITHMKLNFNNFENRPSLRSRHAINNVTPPLKPKNTRHACMTSTNNCNGITSTTTISTKE